MGALALTHGFRAYQLATRQPGLQQELSLESFRRMAKSVKGPASPQQIMGDLSSQHSSPYLISH